jgi:ribonuclease G
MDVKVEEVCPTCHGTGNIKSSLLFTKVLEGKIQMIQNRLGIKSFTLHVHPYVYAYICQGICSLKMKWQWRYGLGIKIIPSQKLGMLQYEFYDNHGHEMDVKEEIEIR